MTPASKTNQLNQDLDTRIPGIHIPHNILTSLGTANNISKIEVQ